MLVATVAAMPVVAQALVNITCNWLRLANLCAPGVGVGVGAGDLLNQYPLQPGLAHPPPAAQSKAQHDVLHQFLTDTQFN